MGASMNCPVCMLSGAENAIRTWERAFESGLTRKAMPIKSLLTEKAGQTQLLQTMAYDYDGPYTEAYTTDEQYAAGAPDNCLPQIAHDA